MGVGNSLLRCCVPSRPLQHGGEDDGGNLIACNRVELAATELFSIPGLAKAFHTSVIVNGEEFFFSDSGIFNDRALTSHQGKPSERFDLGMSAKTGAQLLRALNPFFRPGSYDLVRKNCNSFSDCAIFYLLRKRLETRFSALERLGQSAGHELVQRFTNNMYQPNEEARAFRTEDVMKALEMQGEAELQETMPDGAPAQRFALSSGARVTVIGLKSAEELNGQGAEIIRYNAVNGRWEARVNISGEIKAFRAENLRPAGEMVFLPGDRARIHGLRSEAGQSLNGESCVILRYVHALSRYEVNVDGVTKALKGINLQPEPETDRSTTV